MFYGLGLEITMFKLQDLHTHTHTHTPAEGSEQLGDHGPQLVQADHGVLRRRRTPPPHRPLRGVVVKAQNSEHLQAETRQGSMTFRGGL